MAPTSSSSAGATGADAAAAIGPRLAADALAVKVDGELRDLAAPLARRRAGSRSSRPIGDPDALWLVRHDAAHVMATAVLELWPGTKVSIGPPIEDGFYYDFEFPDGFGPSEADLERIEEAMRAHIAADEPFERTEIAADEAIERFRAEEAVQGRADRGPGARAGRRDRLALPERPLPRPLPRAPRPLDRPDQGVQAQLVAGRVLAGGRERGRCSPASTGRRSSARGARGAPGAPRGRPGPAIIGGSAPSSACSRSGPNRRACRSGCRGARCCSAWSRRRCASSSTRRGYVEIKTPQVLDEELWRRSGHWDNYRDEMFFTEPEQASTARRAASR